MNKPINKRTDAIGHGGTKDNRREYYSEIKRLGRRPHGVLEEQVPNLFYTEDNLDFSWGETEIMYIKTV